MGRRPRTRLVYATVLLALAASAPARGDTGTTAAGATLVDFDARGVASVGSFCVLFARGYPVRVCGGNLESTAIATTDPRGYALAGLSPVPALASVPLLIPNNDPITGTPVPEDVKQALKSFDFSTTPSQCQATYPPVREGDGERTCGGPTAGDGNLGLRGSGLNGHVESAGKPGEPLATTAQAVSRATDAEIPNLQAKLRSVIAFAHGGLNGDGRPQAYAEMNADNLDLFGKVVRLTGIRSTTTVVNDGSEAGTSTASSFTIASASVAGVGVVIGPDGVSVARQAVGDPSLLPSLTRQVNQALADAGGLSLRMLPAPATTTENGRVVAGSGALEIRFHPAPETDVLYRVGYTTAAVNSLAAQPDVAIPDVPASTSPAQTEVAPATDAAGSSPPTGGFPAVPDTVAASTGTGLPPSAMGNVAAAGGALSPSAAVATNRITGDPRLVRRPAVPAVAGTLPSARLKTLFPAYAVFLAVAAGSLHARRRLFAGRTRGADRP